MNSQPQFPDSPWWPQPPRSGRFKDEIEAFGRVYGSVQGLLMQDKHDPITDLGLALLKSMEMDLATQAIAQTTPESDADTDRQIDAIQGGRQLRTWTALLVERLSD
jgi:hypothetical protein